MPTKFPRFFFFPKYNREYGNSEIYMENKRTTTAQDIPKEVGVVSTIIYQE